MKLVFLPGMDGTGILFEPILREFREKGDVRVIAYPTDREQSYDQLIGYVKDQLPGSEDFILVAESFSGPIGYVISADPPANLKATIFVATFVSLPNGFIALAAKLPLTLLMKLPVPDFVVRRYLLGKSIDGHTVSLFRRSLKIVKSNILAHRVRQMAGLKGKSKKIEVPCAYIVAGSDRLVSRIHVEEFLCLSPSMEIIEISGPHFILQAQPEACAKILTRYVTRYQATQSGHAFKR